MAYRLPQMHMYELRCFDGEGVLLSCEEAAFVRDDAAVMVAATLVGRAVHVVEIWDGERKVGRIKIGE